MVEVAAGPSDSATHEKVLDVIRKYGTNFHLLHLQLLYNSKTAKPKWRCQPENNLMWK